MMKYTNKHNIPIEIIRAVENDNYSKERANEGKEDTMTEERMFADVNGWTISGQTDSISLKDNTLKDYKVTSAWTVMNALKDDKPEWVEQLNCYAWLARQNTDIKIDKLNIVAISRDWSKPQYERSSGDYPPAPVTVVNIPLWSEEDQLKFIKDKVTLHQEAEAEYLISGTLPDCSDAERWKRNDTFRVVKEGRKSAVRVLPSEKEAEKYISSHKDKDNLDIEVAIGKPIRCESYCHVAEFCDQYNLEEKL